MSRRAKVRSVVDLQLKQPKPHRCPGVVVFELSQQAGAQEPPCPWPDSLEARKGLGDEQVHVVSDLELLIDRGARARRTSGTSLRSVA